jgi:hypothetical protein
MMSVFRRHYTLICDTGRQAAEAVRELAPDVAVIDLEVPDWRLLVDGLTGPAGSAPTMLVALARDKSAATSAEFNYALTAPVVADELELVFGEIAAARGSTPGARSSA